MHLRKLDTHRAKIKTKRTAINAILSGHVRKQNTVFY